MAISAIRRKFKKLFRLLARRNYRCGLYHRVAAAIEHEEVLRQFRVGCVVDIGANKGQFALAAREAWPAARIIAFEPIPAAAATFRSVFAGDSDVALHQFAIGELATTAILHVSQRQDSSSLLPIGELQELIFPGTSEAGTIEIPVCRLADKVSADEIGTDALLKLDVQGFELQALKGCAELLRCFAHVYAECSYLELYAGQALAGEVIDYLGGQGFRPAGRFNLVCTSDGVPVQADLWFKRDERV